MSGTPLRPRFAIELAEDPDAVVQRIRTSLLEPDIPCIGMIAEKERVIELRIAPADRHYWSPALGLQIEPAEDGDGTVLHGLIGPMPGVWTMLAFATIALGTGLLFLLTFGSVQLILDKDPWAMWLAVLHVILLIVVRVVAGQGRRIAAPQTVVLRHFLEDALGLDRSAQERTAAEPYRP